MQFKKKPGQIVHEVSLMKTYHRFVSELYHKIKSADLPAVQSHEALLLSKVSSRKSTSEVPISTAKTSWELSQHTDGSSCVSVVNNIFMAAKVVPEAMMLPISQLIMCIDQPVLRNDPRGPTFSVPTSMQVPIAPTGTESFCRCFNKKLLKTYIKYIHA